VLQHNPHSCRYHKEVSTAHKRVASRPNTTLCAVVCTSLYFTFFFTVWHHKMETQDDPFIFPLSMTDVSGTKPAPTGVSMKNRCATDSGNSRTSSPCFTDVCYNISDINFTLHIQRLVLYTVFWVLLNPLPPDIYTYVVTHR
jgi:hypothetical protein